ncbi:MAG TPA: hypothetical protein VKT17_03785 [Acidobacteriota bacterium]|nr:hypothetical protein [Acidobacteriota bacterium]
MTLAYAWSRQLASEVEIYIPKRSTAPRAGSLPFTSTLDGLSYNAGFGSFEDVSSTSLLVGLSFRPLRPSFLRPHAVEMGAAAGPAWISWKAGDIYNYDSYYWSDSRRIVTWTARVRFSYDYYLNPSFSMGAFAEYRRLRAGIPAYSRTEMLSFHESTYPGGTLTRTTEVTFPGRTADAGGFAIGLRFGLGF